LVSRKSDWKKPQGGVKGVKTGREERKNVLSANLKEGGERWGKKVGQPWERKLGGVNEERGQLFVIPEKEGLTQGGNQRGPNTKNVGGQNTKTVLGIEP